MQLQKTLKTIFCCNFKSVNQALSQYTNGWVLNQSRKVGAKRTLGTYSTVTSMYNFEAVNQ